MLKINYKKHNNIFYIISIIVLLSTLIFNQIRFLQKKRDLDSKRASIECLQHMIEDEKVSNNVDKKYGYYDALKILNNYEGVNISDINYNVSSKEADFEIEYYGSITDYIKMVEEIKEYDNFKSIHGIKMENSKTSPKISFYITFIKNI